MIAAIESVTLAIDELGASLRQFQETLGLSITNEARASVALLSAWRYPVHESVRLVELGDPALPNGRLRLARFEDARPERGALSAAESATPTGLVAIDFRPGSSYVGGRLAWTAERVALLVTPRSPLATSRVTAIWIAAGDGELCGRFYGEALGFAAERPELHHDLGVEGLNAALGVPSSAPVELTRYRPPDEPSTAIVLARPAAPGALLPHGPRRLGQRGISLLTCRCDDLDSLAKRLRALGIEPLTASAHVSIRGGVPARVLVVRGPSQELIEFIDTSD
jgi:hypothetical protein